MNNMTNNVDYVSRETTTAQTQRIITRVNDDVRSAIDTFHREIRVEASTRGVFLEIDEAQGTAIVWEDAIVSSVVLLATAMKAAYGPIIDELWATTWKTSA
ncbi:hypothetical protein P43SY_010489 [Pythium insidiosum]|uniref:Uncharacterized protein n=1 Tax=Pythium insidiosum TaxID=114742 RepID=A0AAD5LQN9_PYTIN|nr:hypothetical protein P43SY_010489 [Pythium insidiosum]